MDPRPRYAGRVIGQYLKLPGTLRRALREDRRLALALYDRGVSIETVENAFVLALARRTFRSDSNRLEPIRSLHYFLPVIQELTEAPPDPEYLHYLKGRLVSAGVQQRP